MKRILFYLIILLFLLLTYFIDIRFGVGKDPALSGSGLKGTSQA